MEEKVCSGDKWSWAPPSGSLRFLELQPKSLRPLAILAHHVEVV